MDEYACLTLLANPGESEAQFQSRLYAFWTHMLRQQPAEYEKVYAEATEFETEQERVARRYMIQPEVVSLLQQELTALGIEFIPIDNDDLYSKAEASTNEWFQLEH